MYNSLTFPISQWLPLFNSGHDDNKYAAHACSSNSLVKVSFRHEMEPWEEEGKAVEFIFHLI